MYEAIVVVSRGRSDLLLSRGLTLDWVSCASCPVYLAVREDEVAAYVPVLQKYCTVQLMVLPVSCAFLGMYLDAVLQHPALDGVRKVALCDDDLLFSYRDWSSTSLPRLPFDRVDEAFAALFEVIDGNTIHAGFRHRAFAQTCTLPIEKNKRIMWVHGVDREAVLRAGLSWVWDHKVLTDFHFQLSAIRAGYQTAILNSYIVDDGVGPYKNSGGCNTYRTLEIRTAAARALAAEFPEAVTLREKDSPQGPYWDVTVRFGNTRVL